MEKNRSQLSLSSRSILLLFLLFFPACLLSQTALFHAEIRQSPSWSALGRDLVQSPDGGFVVVGRAFNPATSADAAYLVKTNGRGEVQWSKFIENGGAMRNTGGYAIDKSNDGGYFIGGTTQSTSASYDYDAFVMKTDSLGNMIWKTVLGGGGEDIAYDLTATPDGGVVAGGQYGGDSAFVEWSSMIFKLDASGTREWFTVVQQNSSAGGVINPAYSVHRLNDGRYALSGFTERTFGDDKDMTLIFFNLSGGFLYQRTYGVTRQFYADDRAYASAVAADGSILLAGYTSDTIGGADLSLVKTDSAGNVLWSNLYPASTTDNVAFSVIATSDGGFLVGGRGNPSSWLMKIDGSGSPQWTRTLNYGTPIALRQVASAEYAVLTDRGIFPAFDLYKLDDIGYIHCDSFPRTTFALPLTLNNVDTLLETVVTFHYINPMPLSSVANTWSQYMVCCNWIPRADFIFGGSGLGVTFTDASVLNDTTATWLWDFGDGNFSSFQNPSHTYAASGTYAVCLVVTNICGSDTICDFVSVPVGLTEARFPEFELIPNPAEHEFIIRSTTQTLPIEGLEICDALGKTVFRSELPAPLHRVECSTWPRGLYLVRIHAAEGQTVKRLLLK